MKLSELNPIKTQVAESATSELHQDKIEALKNAIKDELDADDDMAGKIVDYLLNNEDLKGVQDFLYSKFESEMPYNVLSDDPSDWIANHMEQLFSKYTKGL